MPKCCGPDSRGLKVERSVSVQLRHFPNACLIAPIYKWLLEVAEYVHLILRLDEQNGLKRKGTAHHEDESSQSSLVRLPTLSLQKLLISLILSFFFVLKRLHATQDPFSKGWGRT